MMSQDEAWSTLVEFVLPSAPGKERLAAEKVGEAVRLLNLPPPRLEKLQTAVAEAALNAMEHGNHFQAELPVTIEVRISDSAIAVRITDQGSGGPIPQPEVPDLEAKLVGQQSPRGWGFFLIRKMVDRMHVSGDQSHHTIELVIDR
jgi:anti-sigma regulatory factor (Ser/Thr protein kinase)